MPASLRRCSAGVFRNAPVSPGQSLQHFCAANVWALGALAGDQAVQSPLVVQRDQGRTRGGRPQRTPRRDNGQDVVLLLGDDPRDRRGRPGRNLFYAAARRHFETAHPAARIVFPPELRSFIGVLEWLRSQPRLRVRRLIIVVHPATDGVVVPFEPGDTTSGTAFHELSDGLRDSPSRFRLEGQPDGNSVIDIRGCNIRRNHEVVKRASQAFGGASVVAPTHRTRYEFTATGAREFFVSYTVEQPGDWRARPAELERAFTSRYAGLRSRWPEVRRRVRRRVIRHRIPSRIAAGDGE